MMMELLRLRKKSGLMITTRFLSCWCLVVYCYSRIKHIQVVINISLSLSYMFFHLSVLWFRQRLILVWAGRSYKGDKTLPTRMSPPRHKPRESRPLIWDWNTYHSIQPLVGCYQLLISLICPFCRVLSG